MVALYLACHTLKPNDQGRFQGGHLKQIVFFSFFFFLLVLQNYFIQEIWNYINDKNYSLNFGIELSSKFVGVGITLALLQDN